MISKITKLPIKKINKIIKENMWNQSNLKINK
jgi:hypothetical protein